MKKILFIANPIAGGRSKETVRTRIAKLMDKSESEWEFLYTKEPGDATVLAAESDADVVVAIGGDGTVNEVARGLLGTDKALGIIPCGSGDGLARHLMISHNIDRAIRTIREMEIRRMDHGVINGLPFFCTCGVGLDAIVSMKFAKSGRRGLIVYIEKCLETWLRFNPDRYRIDIDGTVIDTEAVLITVGNANQWGNESKITPLASLQDGLLDVTVIKPFLSIEIPLLAAMIMDGHIYRSSRVICMKGNQIIIHRDSIGEAHLDGNPTMLDKDIEISVVPDALNVIVPRKKSKQNKI